MRKSSVSGKSAKAKSSEAALIPEVVNSEFNRYLDKINFDCVIPCTRRDRSRVDLGMFLRMNRAVLVEFCNFLHITRIVSTALSTQEGRAKALNSFVWGKQQEVPLFSSVLHELMTYKFSSRSPDRMWGGSKWNLMRVFRRDKDFSNSVLHKKYGSITSLNPVEWATMTTAIKVGERNLFDLHSVSSAEFRAAVANRKSKQKKDALVEKEQELASILTARPGALSPHAEGVDPAISQGLRDSVPLVKKEELNTVPVRHAIEGMAAVVEGLADVIDRLQPITTDGVQTSVVLLKDLQKKLALYYTLATT